MTVKHEKPPTALGFRFGTNGPHAAGTMVFDELRLLVDKTDSTASRADYEAAVVEESVLGKPTLKARELTLRHMAGLYGLDASNSIFRALRRLWPLKEASQPILVLAAALARDPLLRATQDFILGQATQREISLLTNALLGKEAEES